jgi:hypothetical protein
MINESVGRDSDDKEPGMDIDIKYSDNHFKDNIVKRKESLEKRNRAGIDHKIALDSRKDVNEQTFYNKAAVK